ncbi:hypothetical protein C2S53_000784 [Perilla frutescens var. hirtella]|uniref:Phytocyanin domain-containing protein n=1 Tax=Perilla frutescens var. hirtella TaxID=608512 RepID=A0AAD4JPN8_PERFH|nr:hypothetical protein C2S53_000784 [Perilla frutescens var. hirtella]
MASRAFLITIIVAAAAAAPAFAMDYMVGDSDGWKLGVNYTTWAEGKQFYVGDTLMFMYNNASHNVLKVAGPDFQSCNISNAIGSPYTSGKDTFTLAAPGKKWYICGFGSHCSQGMKLVINVNAEGPAPAPGPTSAAGEATPFKSFVWMVVAATAAFSIIMS